MRHKISQEKKRKKLSLTIDEGLSEIFDEYLVDKKIKNKSKYIERLIEEDMKSKGEEIKKEF
jgi:metal-responsive CopG/Arc/MetJ family transcriptional regulator